MTHKQVERCHALARAETYVLTKCARAGVGMSWQIEHVQHAHARLSAALRNRVIARGRGHGTRANVTRAACPWVVYLRPRTVRRSKNKSASDLSRLLKFVALAILLSPFARAQPAAAKDDKPTILLVLGAEGEPEYGKDFTAAANHWIDAAKLASANLIQIGGETQGANAQTDKDRLKEAITAELAKSSQTLWIVFIGHGTFDGKEAKFNLRGPDLSDQELAQWLESAKRPLALINCSSSSAPFLNRLSAPNRIIITATQSGHELQYSRFAGYFAAAIADPAADLDKDGQTSLLEAFLAASHQVEDFYKEQGRLATEHALLDDNGDARGTPATFFQGVRATHTAKDGATPDGLRAHQLHLVLSPAEQAMPPEARVQRDELELQIETLRAKKSTLSEAQYYASLEELLVKLAKVYAGNSQPR